MEVIEIAQSSLLGWVRVEGKPQKVEKRPPERWAYRFLCDFPEGLMTPAEPAGPFKAGDLVSRNAMPPAVWAMLIERGAVEPYRISL